jgi:Tfp pilus assembly protein PilV
MIALVILSIGLSALAALQVHAIKGINFSKRMSAAVFLAEAKIEELKNTSFTSLQSESETEITISNMKFRREVQVLNNNPLPNTRTVQVSVMWKDGAKSYSVPISTVISQ